VFAAFKTELPLMTRILLGTSNFTVTYWPLMIASAISGFFGFRAWTATPAGRLSWDRMKLKLPIAGKILHKGTLARFARSFALSSKQRRADRAGAHGGVADRRQRLPVQDGRADARWRRTRREHPAYRGGHRGIYAGCAADDRGGRGNRRDRRTDGRNRPDVRARGRLRTENLSAQIEPILITFLGALVLVLALGVFLPIWDLGKAAMHK
jgi:MSHA biogenesis protein MshG